MRTHSATICLLTVVCFTNCSKNNTCIADLVHLSVTQGFDILDNEIAVNDTFTLSLELPLLSRDMVRGQPYDFLNEKINFHLNAFNFREDATSINNHRRILTEFKIITVSGINRYRPFTINGDSYRMSPINGKAVLQITLTAEERGDFLLWWTASRSSFDPSTDLCNDVIRLDFNASSDRGIAQLQQDHPTYLNDPLILENSSCFYFSVQ